MKLYQTYNEQYGTTYIFVMLTNLYGLHDNFDLMGFSCFVCCDEEVS
nr:NAD-dependent epimerase/dehydratase family protein [Sporomusa sp. GT1]